MKMVVFAVLLFVAAVQQVHAQPCWWNGHGWACRDEGQQWRGRDWQWHRDGDWRRHQHERREERWEHRW